MKAEKIKELIISEGIEQSSLILEEEIQERCSIRNAAVILLICVSILSGMIMMYFIEK